MSETIEETEELEAAPPTPADFERLMETAIADVTAFDAPSSGSSSSSSSSSSSAEYSAPSSSSEPAPEAPRRGRGKKTMGMPVQPAMAELFTPDGIGRVFTTAVDAFYRACEAAPLAPEEDDALRKMFAYYMQVRMPEDAGKYQPELLLIGALGVSLVPRMQQIAPATAPLFKRIGSAMWRIVSYPFNRGGVAE